MKIDVITTNLEMFLEQYNSKLLLENVNIGRLYLSIADNLINLNIEYNEGYHSDMLIFEESGEISKVEIWNDPNVLINVTRTKPVQVEKLTGREKDSGWNKIYTLITNCATARMKG